MARVGAAFTETDVRKPLVASQKGGVGKTTTSINLAAHQQRQPLRQTGLDLPGVLVGNVLPGLDVLSPYQDGGCSDEDLDHLLALLATPAFQECYATLVVDTQDEKQPEEADTPAAAAQAGGAAERPEAAGEGAGARREGQQTAFRVVRGRRPLAGSPRAPDGARPRPCRRPGPPPPASARAAIRRPRAR